MELTNHKNYILDIHVLIVLLGTCFKHVSGDCAGLVSTLTADYNSYKTVTTDGYPSNYANSLTCEWKIDSGSAADKVAMTYLAFNLETNYDKLTVYDGESASSNMGTNIDTGSYDDRFYISSGRYLFLRFKSDSSIMWSGFKIQYIAISNSIIKPNCGDTITLDETSNIEKQYALNTFNQPITTSFYTTCEWTISSNTNAHFSINIVYADFDDFSTYSCDQTNEYGLSVWEGSTITYQLCGFLPDSLVSVYASGALTNKVKFKAPIINSIDRGFILTLKYLGTSAITSSAIPTLAGSSSSCGSETNPTRLTADNVTIQYVTSPGYPGQYANNLECWWIITAPLEGVQIFPYQINTDGTDTLTIYDGPNSGYVSLASYSGTYSSLSSSVLSTGSSVTIKFETDGSTTDTGFSIGYLENATVIPNCVPTGYVYLNATSNEQSLQSHVGYGSSSYSNDLDSYWLIDTGSTPNTINIKFTSFNIESATSCQYDYFKVYAGACEDEDNKIQLYCGESTDLYFSSTKGRYILIHFHTDYSVTHTGWELKYYTSDVQTEDDSSESSNNWRIGLGVGVFIVIIIFFCVCCQQKSRSRKSRTIPTTTNFQQHPPERKTLPSQIVIKARQPKIKPEYIMDTWKGQQKRNRLQKAIGKHQLKEANYVSNGSKSELTSKSEFPNENPSKNLPPLIHHIKQRSPPPDYREFEEEQKEDFVSLPTNTDQNQAETYKSDPSRLQFDPNNIPLPFEYTMPPQLLS